MYFYRAIRKYDDGFTVGGIYLVMLFPQGKSFHRIDLVNDNSEIVAIPPEVSIQDFFVPEPYCYGVLVSILKAHESCGVGDVVRVLDCCINSASFTIEHRGARSRESLFVPASSVKILDALSIGPGDHVFRKADRKILQIASVNFDNYTFNVYGKYGGVLKNPVPFDKVMFWVVNGEISSTPLIQSLSNLTSSSGEPLLKIGQWYKSIPVGGGEDCSVQVEAENGKKENIQIANFNILRKQ